MTSPDPHGLPSAEAIEAEILPMSYEGADLTECVERILSLIRPAFEAKDAEISYWRAGFEDQCQQKSAAEAKLREAVDALEPFSAAFNAAREKYVRRYGANAEIGMKNFDKMPDFWPMENLAFNMGDFRRARSASAAARGETQPLASSKETP